MTSVIPEAPPVAPAHAPLATEQEAREVAEAAREKDWEKPSFVRQLFEGKLRLDLIHPYPAQSEDELAKVRPFMDRLKPSWPSGSTATRSTGTEGSHRK